MPMTRRAFLEALGASTLVLQGSFLPACGGGDTDDTDTDADGPVLTFAVLTDLHIKADPDHVNNATLRANLARINELGVELLLISGDLVDDLPSDDPEYFAAHDDTPLDVVIASLAEAELPVLVMLGNHDYYTSDDALDKHRTNDRGAREALMVERLGMPGVWYREDHGGVAFYMLSSLQPDARTAWEPGMCGSFGEEQLAWLDDQLADGVPAVLAFHHPLALDILVEAGMGRYTCMEVPRDEGEYEKYEGEVYDGWTDPIYALLEAHADHVVAVFVGHTHWWAHDSWAGIPVLMGDSTGNSVELTEVDGEPMRYHLVRVWPEAGRFEVLNLADIPLDA